MKRFLTLICGTAASVLVAAAVQAEIVGTLVSTDPTANTIVVKTPDGRQMVYRTSETTTIRQGDTAVQLSNVQPGTRVQIVTDAPATPPATAGQVVHPIASGIIVTPTSETTVVPVPSAQPDVAAPRAAGDTDVDIDVDHDVERDDD
jgi:hypothetical protein